MLNALIDAILAGVGVQAAAFALAGVGLNLQFGYTGLLNFGHVAFMLVGAYGTAISVDQGAPLWLGLVIGVVGSVALGILFGLPTLRLRADYLAIVTITAGEILRVLVNAGDQGSLTHGPFGIQRFANDFYALNPFPAGRYGIGRLAFAQNDLLVAIVGWILVLGATLLIKGLVTSPWGRVLRAIREDEDAARSLGKNTFMFKLQSLVIGGVIGSLAGMLLAIDQQSVTPNGYLPALTFFVFTVVILGGRGTVWGPALGAVIFWFVLTFTAGVLANGIDAGWIPSWLLSPEDVASIRFILVGGALMALAIWRPQGILGSRTEGLVDER